MCEYLLENWCFQDSFVIWLDDDNNDDDGDDDDDLSFVCLFFTA